MGTLEDKVILIAGAGLIGGALAQRYAQEGATVVLGDHDVVAAERAVAGLAEPARARVTAIHLDGANEASVAAAVKFCTREWGRLDGLHANFASFADNDRQRGILELPLEVFDNVQHVNVRGFYLCSRAALPHMVAGGGGSILYTSSIGAYTGGASQVAYSMSKSAIHALMRHVASRYGGDGVRANAIAPGLIVDTQGSDVPAALLQWCRKRACIQDRPGTPGDISSLAALLMSDEGSYITGQVICVDGGTTMRS